MPATYVAFSGGKDSTAMALLMAERGEPYELIHTRTGNELPEVDQHVHRVAELVDRPLHVLPAPTLVELIHRWRALPNWRHRWCTRVIKIEPCIAFLTAHPGSTLCVGLRADEKSRKGMYGPYAAYRYPLRELGMGLRDVLEVLGRSGLQAPRRTDCMWCYHQRLADWYRLWQEHPEMYAEGEQLERWTGHTFRSPSRDTWPAALAGLRRRFEAGDKPRGTEDEDSPADRASD